MNSNKIKKYSIYAKIAESVAASFDPPVEVNCHFTYVNGKQLFSINIGCLEITRIGNNAWTADWRKGETYRNFYSAISAAVLKLIFKNIKKKITRSKYKKKVKNVNNYAFDAVDFEKKHMRMAY